MRKLIVFGLPAVLAVVSAVTAMPAEAKAPGVNGRVVFTRFDPTLGGTVTYTANPDGTTLTPLFSNGLSEFAHWSPDGSEVSIFTACIDGQEDCAATIVDPDTGTFRQFKWPDPTLETHCAQWAPDGQRLACGRLPEMRGAPPITR